MALMGDASLAAVLLMTGLAACERSATNQTFAEEASRLQRITAPPGAHVVERAPAARGPRRATQEWRLDANVERIRGGGLPGSRLQVRVRSRGALVHDLCALPTRRSFRPRPPGRRKRELGPRRPSALHGSAGLRPRGSAGLGDGRSPDTEADCPGTRHVGIATRQWMRTIALSSGL